MLSEEMAYLKVNAGSYDLGLDYQKDLSAEARKAIEESLDFEEFWMRYSKKRTVTIEEFEISVDRLLLQDLVQSEEEKFEQLEDLEDLCQLVNEVLKPRGQRLPSEDEWEAAFGANLFPWGAEIPAPEEEISGDSRPSTTGLNFNPSTYVSELTTTALKLGDGGESVCGAYPWPDEWLPLSIPHRMPMDQIADAFYEFLEELEIRPVKMV